MSVLDDLIPTPLNSFTTETLEALRGEGKCESLYLELKQEWKPEDVTRCVAAFANAEGGFLLFGAAQDSDGCLSQYPGLDPGAEYPTLAKDRIVGHVSPLPVWNAVQVESPDAAGRPVLVIRVGRSERTPHVVTTSGRIYVRTPNACDPVRDRSTIDLLTERGRAGSGRVEARWGELRANPWEAGAEGGAIVIVAAAPSPSVGPIYRSLLTRSGGREIAPLFGTPMGDPTLVRLLEDGILCRLGSAEVAIHVDGAVMYRLRILESTANPPAVRAPVVTQLVRAALRGLARLVPAVHQAIVRVQLEGTAGLHVAEPDAQGFWDVSRRPLHGGWVHTVESGTEDASAEATAEAIQRRLLRVVGEAAYEQELPA